MVVLLSHPDQIQDVIFGDEGVIKGYYSPSFFTSSQDYCVRDSLRYLSF